LTTAATKAIEIKFDQTLDEEVRVHKFDEFKKKAEEAEKILTRHSINFRSFR
jgi:hypothetical protein